MKQTSGLARKLAEAVIKDIRRATRRQFSAEEKVRIVLEGLHGQDSIAELCRRAGIASSMYYGWSKEFLEAGKRVKAHLQIWRCRAYRDLTITSREPPLSIRVGREGLVRAKSRRVSRYEPHTSAGP